MVGSSSHINGGTRVCSVYRGLDAGILTAACTNIFKCVEFERLPCGNGIAVGHNHVASAAFCADVLAIGCLQGHIAVSSVDELECLPGSDGIAVGHNHVTAAAFCTDVLAIGCLQGHIAVSSVDELECLPGSDGIAVSHNHVTSATFCADVLVIGGTKSNCRFFNCLSCHHRHQNHCDESYDRETN